ncbi:MAG: sigma-70 family RNA polymerase sigma factor [Chloroflexi bacterium]|nr:MAG: sigma-70 family RNA polymerase sigma factor [Chloroflexota bacterium]
MASTLDSGADSGLGLGESSAFEPAAADAAGEALPLYLREIGRVPLLTAQDEVRLSQAIEGGRAALERLQSEKHLDDAERQQLLDLVSQGDTAREALADANLRLVVSVARRYSNRGVPLIDLIQEGNLGLLRAVEKFDWRRGFKFSTYATWWIRQAVSRAIADDARTIRIPVHLYDVVNRMARISSQLHQELGREPTDEEVGALLHISADRVRELNQVLPQPVSLDGFVGEDQDTPLSDMVADDDATTIESVAEQRLLADRVRDTLQTLTPRERRVIELRFGLIGDKDETLTSIGREIGVTRERIRQIESKALRKLRHPSRAKRLRGFRLN